MEKILIPHGKLKALGRETGFAPSTCSKYLKGYYDETDPFICKKAEQVRELALSMGGIKGE